MTRYEKVGNKIADALIEMLHLFYQKKTAFNTLVIIINRLQVRMEDFK